MTDITELVAALRKLESRTERMALLRCYGNAEYHETLLALADGADPPPPQLHPQARPFTAFLQQAAKAHGVALEDILGGCRKPEVVRARHEAIRTIKAMRPKMSSGQLGAVFRQDHTTILYALGVRSPAKCNRRKKTP